MRNQPETVHEYNISLLNWIFAGCSLLFLGSILWMIYDDWQTKKPWKAHQTEFARLEANQLVKEAQQAHLRAQQKGLAEIEAALNKINDNLKEGKTRTALEAAETALNQARVAFEIADRNYKFEKANLDAQNSKYDRIYEEARAAHPDWRPPQIASEKEVHEELEARNFLAEKVETLRLVAETADTTRKKAQEGVNEFVGKKNELNKQEAALLLDKKNLEERITAMQDPVTHAVLDAPILEFARPNLTFNQKVIENYRFSVNFTDVPRVDRCMTCHVAADKRSSYPTVALPADQKRTLPFSTGDDSEVSSLIEKGHAQGFLTQADVDKFVAGLKFENTPKGLTKEEWDQLTTSFKAAGVPYRDFYATLAEPYRNHPHLDLFVANDSPHPADKFGCTACHWGWDREVEFSRATHSPDSEKQKEEWIHKYHWKPAQFFNQPMRQARFLEANCLKCHAQVTEVPRADKLNLGRALIETAGCFGCHQVNQLETRVPHKITELEGVPADLALDPKKLYDERSAAMETSLQSIAQLYGINAETLRAANIINKPSDLMPDRMLTIPTRSLGKRGPSLEKIASKTTPDWTRQWLASPRGFRPNTWMPHFWSLQNSPDPERDALEISTLTAYLFAISEKHDYAQEFAKAPPGNAAKGKTLVNNLGCLACHIVGQTYDQIRSEKVAKCKDLSPAQREVEMARFERDLLMRSRGPSLDGMGRKTSAAWLYAWVLNPTQYHATTRMPNMRLSPQEAADLAAFLSTLQPASEPAKPTSVSNAKLDAVTQEYLENNMPRAAAQEILQSPEKLSGQAAEALGAGFSEREVEKAFRTNAKPDVFEETMRDANKKRTAFEQTRKQLGREKIAQDKSLQTPDAQKNLFLGRKMVERYGCFGCHEIKGFEKGKPIGPELTEWGSKSVLKLDYGSFPENIVPRTNIAFLHQKLAAPRSLDKTDTKKPQEFLRMPQFAFSETQIEAITTHILGQTTEKISPQGARNLSQTDGDLENGRWLVKELNCVGCHVFEGKGKDPLDPHFGKGGAIRMTIADKTFWPPSLWTEGAKVQPEWLFKFLKNPTQVRPAFFEAGQHARMPNFNLSDEQVNILIRYFAAADNQNFPFDQDTLEFKPKEESAKVGHDMFSMLQCVGCHNVVPSRPVSAEQILKAGPDLTLSRVRLKPAWVVQWLSDPQKIAPGVNMPTFWPSGQPSPYTNFLGGDRAKQLQAVRDFLWVYPGLTEKDFAPAPSTKPAESLE